LTRPASVVLIGLVLLVLVCSAGFPSQSCAKSDSGKAAFTTMKLSQTKIYEGENVTLTFAARNLDSPETHFYIQVYRSNQLVYNGRANLFEVAKGEQSKDMLLVLGGWTGPEAYSVMVELRSIASDTLHDVRSLSLTVVKLMAGKLTSSPSRIVWGLNSTSPLTLSFTNTGNDGMQDAVVTVMSSSLRISPLSSGNLGIVPSGGTKSLTFTLSHLDRRETKPGPYRISLRLSFNDFRGVAHHQDENLDLTIEKMKPRILATYSPASPKYGEPIRFRVELLDENKKPLAGEQVTFLIGSTTARNETSPSGVATYASIAPVDSGNHSFRVDYGGSEYYLSVSEALSLRITPLATLISIFPPKTLNATFPAALNMQLLDERMKAAFNQTVKFTIVSKSKNFSQTRQTGFDGRASLTLNLNKSGSVRFDISFAGSRNYVRGSNSSTIRIDPASTRITLRSDPALVLFGDSADLEITMRDLLNRSVNNVSLMILADKSPATSLSIDSRGYAKTRLIVEPTLFYRTTKVQVIFNGDETYSSSIAETEIVTINPTAVVAFSAVAAGGVASILLLIARRKALEESIPPPRTKPVRPKKIEAEQPRPLSPFDEKVYRYIVEHSGVISWSRASQDLSVTVEELKESTQRLRDAGRLAESF